MPLAVLFSIPGSMPKPVGATKSAYLHDEKEELELSDCGDLGVERKNILLSRR
jgi:hypothetical protein